jgi:hypothetical protein
MRARKRIGLRGSTSKAGQSLSKYRTPVRLVASPCPVPVPPQSRRWTITVPGAIGAALGFVLGTLGWFAVGFGQATVCTDFNEAPHACDALYHWLDVGFIGQWVLLLVSGFLLAFGVWGRPRSRTPASIAAWVTVALAVGWYGFYYHFAYLSFKVH